MKKIRWGIIGCGDVTEKKSGPAFNKVPNSELVAVMRRDAEKAQDYARRHGVPKWYSNAHELINDPEVNAVYIATPPDTHEVYTLAAIQAGKPVYVEKPMSTDAASAKRMAEAAAQTGVKLSVAHYRREQPLFKKVKQLITDKHIGAVRYIQLELMEPLLTAQDLQNPRVQWRVNPAVAGGGLFHDLAPHQLDLMLYFFGAAEKVSGIAVNQSQQYAADDMVSGSILFQNSVLFNGLWCFNAPPAIYVDKCIIVGSEGIMSFPIFDHKAITITQNSKEEILHFERLEHVQQPMIEKVVAYFLDEGPNPSSAAEGVTVMQWMDKMTKTAPIA